MVKKFALPDAGRNSGAVFGNQLQFSKLKFSVFSFQYSDGILLPMLTEH